MKLPVLTLIAAASLCFVAPVQASPSSGDGWDWLIAPYGWAASVSTDVRTSAPPSESSVDTSFADLVEDIDGAFMVRAEGQGDKFGFLVDFTYLGLADANDRQGFHSETDFDTRLIDAAMVWSPDPDKFNGLETFAGVRVLDADFTTNLTPNDPAYPTVILDADDTMTDFLLGIRYTTHFSDKWGMTVHGDGSWGDTDGTWNTSIFAQYRMTHGTWAFGYRYMDLGFAPGTDKISVQMHGPLIGYAFRF